MESRIREVVAPLPDVIRRAVGRFAALPPFPDRPHVAAPPRTRIRMP